MKKFFQKDTFSIEDLDFPCNLLPQNALIKANLKILEYK